MSSLDRTLAALAEWGFLTLDEQTKPRLRRMFGLPETATDDDVWRLIQESQRG